MIRPILFNTEMVRAILEGRKTVTRRVVKDPYYIDDESECRIAGYAMHRGTKDTDGMPYPDSLYSVNDILYVREKFACAGFDGEESIYVYWTDVDDCDRVVWGNLEKGEWAPSSDYHWRPSIHMPKDAARIFLRVTDVRVERLQEIDGAGIKAEGTEGRFGATRGAFINLWNSTIPKHPNKFKSYPYRWEDNPWVWVIEFERCEKPEEG